MRTIKEEYARLQDFLSTQQGWEIFEEEWLEKTNGLIKDGIIIQSWDRNYSAGFFTKGFAIDPETKYYIFGDRHSCHSKVITEVADYLIAKLNIDPKDAYYNRVIRGWYTYILDFEFPCIFISSQNSTHEIVKDMEDFILEKGKALPVSSLFRQHHIQKC